MYRMLPLLLCLLLTACASEKTPSSPQTNLTENTQPSETTSKDTDGTEENDALISADTAVNGVSLSAEALAEYDAWFSQTDENGLLRFPYTDSSDIGQIAPYLYLLFYHVGETDLSETEYTLLEAAGMPLELDNFRLRREYMVNYLTTLLNMTAEDANTMLTESGEDTLGYYLSETDAWYLFHGDFIWTAYTFSQGTYFADTETVVLYYTNPFLTTVNPDGETEYSTDVPMVVMLSIEGGECRILSHIRAS